MKVGKPSASAWQTVGNSTQPVLSAIFVNANSWETGKLVMASIEDLGVKADLFMLAETKLGVSQLANADSFSGRRGFKHHGSSAIGITSEAGKSGGVSVLSYKKYAAKRLQGLPGSQSRFVGSLVSVGGLKVVFGSVYLRPAVGILGAGDGRFSG